MVPRLDTLMNGWARSPLRVPPTRGGRVWGARTTSMITTITRVALTALLVSSVVMGLAISGMHYTGMLAARFSGTPTGSITRTV